MLIRGESYSVNYWFKGTTKLPDMKPILSLSIWRKWKIWTHLRSTISTPG